MDVASRRWFAFYHRTLSTDTGESEHVYFPAHVGEHARTYVPWGKDGFVPAVNDVPSEYGSPPGPHRAGLEFVNFGTNPHEVDCDLCGAYPATAHPYTVEFAEGVPRDG
jgi:hypothetical protein